MGWSYLPGCLSVESLKREFEQEKTLNDGTNWKLKIEASTCYGTRLWGWVLEDNKAQCVVLFLIRRQRSKDYGWETGYKDMVDSSGPYYLDCPLYLIERVEKEGNPSPDAQEWYNDVRIHRIQQCQKRIQKKLKHQNCVSCS